MQQLPPFKVRRTLGQKQSAIDRSIGSTELRTKAKLNAEILQCFVLFLMNFTFTDNMYLLLLNVDVLLGEANVLYNFRDRR